ncbi:DUF134 domain-containing protein [Paludicola sp. MB14-C6]|uniref:DUF134 domain-containing protein n=1 Tax=Paludihabitans sp. MB14-C6 TaxID=3070656 RepID=UPI0027DE2B12|nr:DUF134 domain-containing protein [Paludicola sp. MB14-C6]WMJ23782.1 DUF134 domain-containing protein [Paludicola sp. MB14-C6]
MPRPRKCRMVCSMPNHMQFAPKGTQTNASVIMSVDEYECIRLIDLEQCTQEQCAVQMQIARTTVTAIYEKARRKLADALVNGKTLLIEGGDFALCDHKINGCCKGHVNHCCKRANSCQLQKERSNDK